MSRHGRPHQPHLGGDPDAPRPEAAGQEAHDAARAEDPRGSEDGAPGGGAPREDVPAEHAPAAPTPQAPAEAEQQILDELARLAREPIAGAALVPRIPAIIPQLMRTLQNENMNAAELSRQ